MPAENLRKEFKICSKNQKYAEINSSTTKNVTPPSPTRLCVISKTKNEGDVSGIKKMLCSENE
jgi:hypothetical protein